jgi:hypothetical protein
MDDLAAVAKTKRVGTEPFHVDGDPLLFQLDGFWSWAFSNLLGNALRGVLAEYLVAKAIGSKHQVREEWDTFDLVSAKGTKVEVKSSAYLQSWKQRRYSQVSFDIRETEGWDAALGRRIREKIRWADVYVFCLLAHTEKSSVDPMNLGQWKFYVLSTSVLNDNAGAQNRLSLSRLLAMRPASVCFAELGEAVESAAANKSLQPTARCARGG